MKNHNKFECDACDKNFSSEDLLGKHVKVRHENVKWYCHFFNNGKDCPHGDKCIFLHESSVQCKYGRLCERNFCMFKHEKSIGKNEEI